MEGYPLEWLSHGIWKDYLMEGYPKRRDTDFPIRGSPIYPTGGYHVVHRRFV